MTEPPAGSWVHAHEEDHDGDLVFRPADVTLGPSRGRRRVTLAPGGDLVEAGPGPDDRPRQGAGHWSVVGDLLTLLPDDGAAERWQIRSADADRLVVRVLGDPA